MARPTGRKPIAIEGRREGGGEEDPRRHAPGCIEAKQGTRGAQEWAEVVGGKRRNMGDANGTDGRNYIKEEKDEGEGNQLGQGNGEDKGIQMPPQRSFEMPTASRQTLAQLAEAEEERIGKQRQKGATEQKLQKMQERKALLDEQVRMAGGWTTQSLGYQIRREEDNKRKADMAIKRLELESQTIQEEVEALQLKIKEIREVQDRHEQRRQVASRRLAYLATQKARESMPTLYLQSIHDAATVVAESGDPKLQPLKELLAVLVDRAEHFNLTSNDSSSEQDVEGASDITEEALGRTGEEEEEDLHAFDEERRTEIALARQRLSEVQKQYQEALDLALDETSTQPAKRRLGEDEPKSVADIAMHEEKDTSALTPVQVVDFFRQRIREATATLQDLKRASAKELVPVGQGRLESNGTSANEARRIGKGEGRRNDGEKTEQIVGDNGSASSFSSSSASSASSDVPIIIDEKQKEQEEEGGGGGVRWKGHPTVEAQIQMLLQDRMQKQQEVERLKELALVQKMAVVRKAASEIQNRCRAAPY